VGQRLHAIRRSDSGFTLTELLIVIVILGVLTGIVVFAVGQFSNRGEVSACKAAMKTVEVAVETYRANKGTLPADVTTAGGAAPATVLVPDYLRTDPTTNKYTITYYLAGRAASAGPPVVTALAPGAVTGDLAGGAVTEDCSA
jgi:prepilin-type N-terminal cleavage/methylation domain-containing protein